MFGLITSSPFFLQFKLFILAGVIALAAGGAGWAVYKVEHARAQKLRDEAVASALKDIQAKLDAERLLRAHYKSLSEDKLELLLQSISNVQVVHKTITNNITKERETFREFYVQALPAGGYEEWKRSRALSIGLPASSPLP